MVKFSEINQDEKILTGIKDFIRRPFGFLLFAGPNGTGKSFAALAIYNALSRYKFPEYNPDESIFVTQAEMNMKVTKSFAEYGQNYYLYDQYAKTKLLIIDDLGTRTPTDSFMDFLYLLSDTRYRNKDYLGTVITTNLNAISMREKFGDAFVSRVASGKCFRFEGKDRRIQEF